MKKNKKTNEPTMIKRTALNGQFKLTDRHSSKSDYEVFDEVWETAYLIFNIVMEKDILKIKYQIEPALKTEEGERTGKFVKYEASDKRAYIVLDEPINLKGSMYQKEGRFPVTEFQLWMTWNSIYYSVTDPSAEIKKRK